MADSAPIFLSITQTIGMFGTFLPAFSEVRRADKSDPEFTRDVRMGELAAAALCLGVGATASAFTDSNKPILAAALTALVLVAFYEYALADKGVSPNAAIPE